MYHAIVRRRIRRLFDAINRGDAEPVLRAFAPRFEHAFLGDHALGGSRQTLPATRRWYERLYRLLPDIHFDLRIIAVSGGPWNTVVVVDWEETNSGTDNVRTYNRGIHVVQLRSRNPRITGQCTTPARAIPAAVMLRRSRPAKPIEPR